MYKLPTKYPELIQSISPQIDFSGSGTLKIGTNSYRWSNISGVDENYSVMKNYQSRRDASAVHGYQGQQAGVRHRRLSQPRSLGGNGLGQTLKIGANKFRIVGVLAAKVSDPDHAAGQRRRLRLSALTTAMRLSSQSIVSNYAAVMVDEGQANEAKAAVEQGLYDIFKSDNAYYVYSASEWLEEMNKMINMVIVILTGIASISLLVGGIGIMNIMLVSVTERTREIGIRKAMGAKEKTILAQFVTEAATTSALGGTLGIVLGYIVSAIANQVLPMFTDGMDITVSPSFNSIAAAFGISVFIGVLFGYLPAKRAARLNPIDALRYD